jgi:hypothetical protein
VDTYARNTDREKQRANRRGKKEEEAKEEEEEGSKLRVSLSQGQRHSSISADRASLEGGCMMLYRVPHFSGTRLQHQGSRYSSSSSPSASLSFLLLYNPAIDRPLSAQDSFLFLVIFLLFYFLLHKSRQHCRVIYHLWFLLPYSPIKQTRQQQQQQHISSNWKGKKKREKMELTCSVC